MCIPLLAKHFIIALRCEAPAERFFNRAFGFLVGMGLGFPYNYLLQVRGRKSGKIYSTPINLLELNGKNYLVAPRGRTQWVRNAEAVGEIALKKGRVSRSFRLRPLSGSEKLQVLKEYLDRYQREVKTYFPVPPRSSVEQFRSIEVNYPAFELTST